MDSVSLEKSLELKQIGPDTYHSVYCPLWTWPSTKVVPGGTLMSLAANAAYETVESSFSIDTLHAHFLSGPKSDQPLQLKVHRLSDGGRFATRVVTVEQSGVKMVHVTCSFVRASALQGPSMTHSVARRSQQTIDEITLDDLAPGRNERGPYMRFQRFPLLYTEAGPKPDNPPPESMIYTSVASISPPIKMPGPKIQALGIIALSDYHVLDGPPTLHSLSSGIPAINDHSRVPTKADFSRFTSLNHSIRFRIHDGFRADELCYIEVTSPWTSGRRGEVQTRIFDRQGLLMATCTQEAYYVLKDDKGARVALELLGFEAPSEQTTKEEILTA